MSILELFKGELTITEIIHMEIPFLNDMVEAKERLLTEKERYRKKLEKEAMEQRKEGASSGTRTNTRK